MDLYWLIETAIMPEKRIIRTNHFFIIKKDQTGNEAYNRIIRRIF